MDPLDPALDIHVRLPLGLEKRLAEILDQAGDVLAVLWWAAAAVIALCLVVLLRRLQSTP